MSSTGLADLRKVRDHDNSTVVPTLAWIGACGATITLVSLVTRRHAERERELWVEAVYARAASDDAADGPPEPPAGTRESTTPPAPGGDR